MNKNKYDKAVTRVALTKGLNSITDAEVIIELENEIEYYRNKVQMLESVRESNREATKKDEELIKDLRRALVDMLKGKDIFNIRTLNQVRNLLGYEKIQYDYDFNEDITNKKSVETLNKETDDEPNNNIKEITTTNIYADDKVTKTITEYKYNEEVE